MSSYYLAHPKIQNHKSQLSTDKSTLGVFLQVVLLTFTHNTASAYYTY